MLMQVGPLQFDIAPLNAHQTTREAKTDYAKKDVIGRRKIYEYVGEGDESFVVEGRLFPFKLGGLGALALLNTIRVSGMPQFVVRGDGAALGWFVIISAREVGTYLHASGVGQQIELSVTLERADSPGALGAFTNLFGLAP